MLEMTKEFDKRLIYVENDVYMWEMLKYLRNGFSMFGMALEFDNRLKYVGTDECMWEMA